MSDPTMQQAQDWHDADRRINSRHDQAQDVRFCIDCKAISPYRAALRAD